MKYGYNKININPRNPVTQAGFLQQTSPINQVHDPLYARLVVLDNESQVFVICSLDCLGISVDLFHQLEQAIQTQFDRPCAVYIAATHTHFGGSSRDETYAKQLQQSMLLALQGVELVEYQTMEYTHQSTLFAGIGTGRNHSNNSHVYLDLCSMYGNGTKLCSFIVHNVHPTIMGGDTPFFSAEYPGYVLTQLEKQYPEEAFLFFQGAAGDISSRFVRKEQSYDEVIRLGSRLVEEIRQMHLLASTRYQMNLNATSKTLALEHQKFDMNRYLISPHKTERELETIEIGKLFLERHPTDLATLPTSQRIDCLDLGQHHFVFLPNELFSGYYQAVDKQKVSLVCYAQGYAPYVTDIDDNILTYEKFTDTWTEDTKIRLFALLRTITKEKESIE